MDHTQKLTHISLCTGYGGIDLGLSRALGGAIRTISYVEIEAFAISNLVAKIEGGHLDTAPIYSDLKTFPWRSFRERVDIVTGGFPCQPFSSAGLRAGAEDPRHLFPYILEGLRELGRPPFVFLENVEGIISSRLKGDRWADPKGTPVLLHVLRELERLGYDAEAGIFSAREVGAPHQRKRVFIMGVRSDLNEFARASITARLENDEPCKTVYPLQRGTSQPDHEPPRVIMGNTYSERSQRPLPKMDTREPPTSNTPGTFTGSSAWRDISRAFKSKVGRDVDGLTNRLGHAELQESSDNRIDELRLLGNGVVPDTARRAFKELWREIAYNGRAY